jgi:hypothetical protein
MRVRRNFLIFMACISNSQRRELGRLGFLVSRPFANRAPSDRSSSLGWKERERMGRPAPFRRGPGAAGAVGPTAGGAGGG